MCTRVTFLMLLLFVANAHKYLWVLADDDESKLTCQMSSIEMDQLMQIENIESLINRFLQVDTLVPVEVSQTEKTLTAVQTMSPDCQSWLKTAADVSKTNLISADGKHLYFNQTSVNWFKARDWCLERKIDHASLKTLSQVQAVIQELRSRNLTSNWVWLSGSNIDQTSGQFHWADGTQVDNSLWKSGHPDNNGKELCVDLNTNYTKLVVNGCSTSSYILCEVPKALATCLKL